VFEKIVEFLEFVTFPTVGPNFFKNFMMFVFFQNLLMALGLAFAVLSTISKTANIEKTT
jgi:hypothetical protein